MNKAHKCKFCGQSYNWRSNLSRHILNVHEGIRRAKQKHFKCNVCGLEVYEQGKLIRHMRTHTGERPFKCTFDACGMEFKEPAHLKRHIKHKHSSDRALKCEVPSCPYTAKTSENLILHMKVHCEDRPFLCSHSGCNVCTKRKEDLSRHTKTVHSSLKMFSCSKCKHRTNCARSLASHMIVHNATNEKIVSFVTKFHGYR